VDYSLLVLGGDLLLKGATPIRADIAIQFDDSAARTGPSYGEIGDLEGVIALDTLDASGLFIHAEPGEDGVVRVGAPVSITVRRGSDPESQAVWALGIDGAEPTTRP
jgi:hypothetical protein